METQATESKRRSGGYRHTDAPIQIAVEELSVRERKLLDCLAARPGEPMTLHELAVYCYPHMRPAKRAYWCVKNSVRRLLVGRHIEKLARGVYRVANPELDAEAAAPDEAGQ